LAEKLKVALPLVVVAGGPEVIVVCGAVWSIVHVWVAGVGSTLPARSVAWTRNWWLPGVRPVYARGEVQAA
jgi:hypothetical protein